MRGTPVLVICLDIPGGRPRFPGSQDIPDVPYHKYAELPGLRGIYCGKGGQGGRRR